MNVTRYPVHFGLRERPFSLSPDPDFLFWSPAHKLAYAVLQYGLHTSAQLTLLTGEVGTGKTILIQKLLTEIGNNLTVGLISNPQGDRRDLLRWALNSLDVHFDPGADHLTLFQTFQDFVIDEYADGHHVVLIIDEAQNLGVDVLEELRMLTNINSGKDEVLQIFLVGQPQLRDLVSQPCLHQFAQRITMRYHLDAMDLTTARDYIRHRLRHAGGSGNEFTEDAVARIHLQAEGIPRMINKLCELGLVYTASCGKLQVDADIIFELLNDGLIPNTGSTSNLLIESERNLEKTDR